MTDEQTKRLKELYAIRGRTREENIEMLDLVTELDEVPRLVKTPEETGE